MEDVGMGLFLISGFVLLAAAAAWLVREWPFIIGGLEFYLDMIIAAEARGELRVAVGSGRAESAPSGSIVLELAGEAFISYSSATENGTESESILLSFVLWGGAPLAISWENDRVINWRIGGRKMPPANFKEELWAADILRAILRVVQDHRRAHAAF